MKQIRQIIFWLHLISGVAAGIFIFVMCATGALLAFKSNILSIAERGMRVVEIPAGNSTRLTVREIIEKVQAAKPSAKISSIALQNQNDAAATVSLGREGQLFANPYTGEITGAGASNWRAFFRVVEDAHRWLAIPGENRTVGKSLNDAANLLFLFLAISGGYIWFPRRLSRRHFKSAMILRPTLKGKARDFNWHTVIGFWSSLVLIILTLTGVVISYQWAGNLVYTLTGNEAPKQQVPPNQQAESPSGLPENLDRIWAKAENYTRWKTLTLRLPVANNAAVFTIDEGKYLNSFGRSTLTVDAQNAEISKWESYGEQNAGRKLRSWFRFTHTGETGGFIGQFIAFAACVGGLFLVWTGFLLSLRRFRGWRTERIENH